MDDFDDPDIDTDDEEEQEEEEDEEAEERGSRRTKKPVTIENKYEFTLVKCPVFDNLKEHFPDTITQFDEWGLTTRMRFVDYKFDKPFRVEHKRDFVLSFFRSATVQESLRRNTSPGRFDVMSFANDIDNVNAEAVPCNVLNMEFFDRLWVRGVVRDGEMVKSKPDSWGDVPCKDDVRKMMLLKYDDNYDLFNKQERSEFIFRIFQHVTLSGDTEKYETEVGPYLHTARILYKQLVTVIKDQNTGALFVESPVFKIEGKMGNYLVFPGTNGARQHYAYFIIDNRRQQLRLWSNVDD